MYTACKDKTKVTEMKLVISDFLNPPICENWS